MPKQKRREFFQERFPVEKMFRNPVSSGPVFLHSYERLEEMIELLKEIKALLEKNSDESKDFGSFLQK